MLLVILVWIIWASGCATPSVAPTTDEEDVEKAPPTVNHLLKDIRVVDMEVHFYLVPSDIKDIYYSAFNFNDPLRLVLDLPDTKAENVPSPLAVGNEIIGEITITTFTDDARALTRIQIGLNQDTGYFIDQAKEEIWVIFLPDQQLVEAAADRGEPVVRPEVEKYTPETKKVKAADTPQPPAQEQIEPPPTVEKEPLPPATRLLAIEPVAMKEDSDVHIIGDGRLDKYNVFLLSDPPRLVVDLLGVKSTEVKEVLTLNIPWIKKVRVGQHPEKVRVVFDLNFIPKGEPPFQLTLEENRLVVSLTNNG